MYAYFYIFIYSQNWSEYMAFYIDLLFFLGCPEFLHLEIQSFKIFFVGKYFLFFFKKMFILREREGEAERRERISSRLYAAVSKEPDMGLDPMN